MLTRYLIFLVTGCLSIFLSARLLRFTLFTNVKSSRGPSVAHPPHVPVVFAVIRRHVISSIRFARRLDVILRT